MKRVLLLLALMFTPLLAHAQFTTVTATVKDPNGIPYAGAILNAVLVPSVGGGYTLSGQPYSGRIGPVTLDSTGSFTVNFGDVTLITPGSPQWQITIDSAAATLLLSLGTGPQSFTYTSSGTTISGSSPVSLTSALNALAPKLTNFAGAGTGTIAGTVTASHIPYASGANTLSDIAGSAVTGGTGAIALTAGADTTTPVTINSHSTTQSATMLDISNQSSGAGGTTTLAAPLVVEGRGEGAFNPGSSNTVVAIQQESAATAANGLILTNKQAVGSSSKTSTLQLSVPDNGIAQIAGGNAVGDGSGNYSEVEFHANPTLYGAASQPAGLAIAISGAGNGTVPLTLWQPIGGAGPAANNSFQVCRGTALGFCLAGFDSGGAPGSAATNVNLFFNGTTSGTAKLGAAAAAGTPCTFLLPTTSPSAAGQYLSTAAASGGACQTSWSSPTLSLASGSGSGSNYSGTNTSYAAVDTTNLCKTVTVPTGSKLDIVAKGNIGTGATGTALTVAVSDVGATCTSGGTTPLDEEQATPPTAGVFNQAFTLVYVLTGDGAAHSIALLAKTGNAADSWIINNSSTTLTARMRLLLIPSN